MQDHELRVITERTELELKFNSLTAFLAKERPSYVDVTNWELLKAQSSAMSDYLEVLNKRISLFNRSTET